jgi:NAD(P)-dependent dehydrogenase (short-subunit alcohol dehydrogenase family)
MDEPSKETVLITGAGSGFGLLASIECARRGLRVFASMRDLGKAARLDEAAAKAQISIEKVRLDVTQAQSIADAVGEVVKQTGRIDVLVNNAGFGMAGALEDLTLDELREQLETNFFGVAALTKAVLPAMRERRHGRIINVSSMGGRFATPGFSAYCASKFAVEGLSESLRHELRPFGIWVSLVEPGMFKTDIFDKNRRVAKRAFDPASPYYAFTKQMESVAEKLLARSKADPEDVARVIARAATVKRPRLRYLVGRDARGQVMAKALLPFGIIEGAVDRYIGMPTI